MDYPESDEIEPEQAKYLYENHCAFLVLEGLPVGSEFGIDLQFFRTGEKFKGVKLIPPGIHFIFASATDKITNQAGPRCGFFHNFVSKEILVKRWSPLDEDFLSDEQPCEEVIERYRANIKDLDRYLGAYRYSSYKTFKDLTSHLTNDCVKRLMPDCDRIRTVPYLTRRATDQPTTRVRRFHRIEDDEHNLLPELRPDDRTIIKFTKIPETHLDSNHKIDFDRVTEYNLDTTTKLVQTFVDSQGIQHLLGEFQFSFLVFILCHVYDCFERWKCLLQLICNADSGLSLPSLGVDFYSNFVRTLKSQLHHVSPDIFEDLLEEHNLIRSHLRTFLQNVEDCEDIPKDSSLLSLASDLRSFLEEKFEWHLDIDLDEDEPVIVEIS